METRFSIQELLDGGEWACAHGDSESLARVAWLLACLLPPPHARVARAIARMCPIDLPRASLRFGALAAALRGATDRAALALAVPCSR